MKQEKHSMLTPIPRLKEQIEIALDRVRWCLHQDAFAPPGVSRVHGQRLDRKAARRKIHTSTMFSVCLRMASSI